MILRFLMLIISLMPALWSALPPQTQLDETAVLANEAFVSYPREVTFRLEIDPDVAIEEATLTYDVEQISCLDVSTQVPVEVDGSNLEWEWVMIRSGNPPPGATMWWEWTLTDNQGQTYTTPRQEVTFEDDRFEWQTVSDDNITVHWYAGEEVGPMLLEAAVHGLELLEADLGIELQEAVEFYIYGSPEEMRDAVLYIQDWAGGVAFSEHNVILMGVPPAIAAEWGRDTVRHELAHLVVGQIGRSCVGGSRPSWLEEGLAMYAEGDSSDQTQADLDQALRENDFIPLRSLNGAFPAHGDAASLAYSQSYSVIQYLSEEYGQDMLQALIQALSTGESYDDALQMVYGFNVDELEQRWRRWLGAPARVLPPTATPLSAAAVPTMLPLSGPDNQPTPQTYEPLRESEQNAVETSSLCGLGLIPLALLGVFSVKSRKPDSPR